MTVICGMKFNGHSGAIVADEQSSNFGMLRKYDLAAKVHILKPSEESSLVAIMGGSGASSVLQEVYAIAAKFAHDAGAKVESKEQLAGLVSQAMTIVKRRYINGYLQNTFGISEVEFLQGYRESKEGKSPIDGRFMEKYMRIASGYPEERISPLTSNDFLLLSSDKEGVDIYQAGMELGNPMLVPRPYHVIGSGSDMADSELSSFFDGIARDNRHEVNETQGLMALLFATDRASARNIGVGGTPFIYVLRDGKVLNSPVEANSRLAGEVVRASKYGYVPRPFAEEAVSALVYKGENFAAVEEALWKNVQDKDKFSLFLRGYKI